MITNTLTKLLVINKLEHMEAWLIIVFVFLYLSALIIIIIITRARHSVHLPPGPLHLPIITDILWLRISFQEFKPFLRKVHAKHGPMISFRFWSNPHIFIADRSLAHQALIQNGVVFADRPKPFSHNNSDVELKISSSCYGPTWRVLRHNLASVMLHPFSHTRKRVLDDLINQLKSDAKSSSKNNNSIKVIDHIQHAMFCLLVFMCFGEGVDNEKIDGVKHVQRRSILSTGKLDKLNLFPKVVTHVLFRKHWRELLQIRKAQKNLLGELIRARKKETEKDVLCYVDTLLNLQLPEEKRELDEGEVVALCSEFLTAGTDTTSTALEWVMANLVKHPHVQQRLVEEIGGVVGDDGREGKKEVREEDLEKLPYLKAVILEGLRRHPPTHFVVPHAVTEDVIFNGYLVPKNGTVNFVVAEMGWDPSVWEDPMVFKPERFLLRGGESGGCEAFDITGKNEIKMMPFGAGRRICPGYNLAMLHLEYFVANLVWNFEWKSSLAGNVDLSEKQEFTMVMKHPLQAQISPRI